MRPLAPYAIGERPGGYSRLRQKPRGLFGEPAWNSLAEYRRTRGVDSKLPPGLPSDVTRVDHARPQDSALGGYEPLPTGRSKAAAVSLGGIASGVGKAIGGVARLGRAGFRSPRNLQARFESARDVLNLPAPHHLSTPRVDPDEIRSYFGAPGRRFWAQEGRNTSIPNTLANRVETFYAGTPQEPLMREALARRAAGNHFGTGSAFEAETEAVRGLTGDPTITPHQDWLGANVQHPGTAFAPMGKIVVPKLDYRNTEGALVTAGGLGLGTAGGTLLHWLRGGGEDGAATQPAGAVAGGAAAGATGEGGGPLPSGGTYGLGDMTADVIGHVGRHLPEYGLGAAALGGTALLAHHLRRRRAERERQQLQEALLAKAGAAEDPFVAAARACPTAAGVLAYCGERGYGEAEIRHLVIKTAGAVPGLAEEFGRLFEAAAGSLEHVPDVTRPRVKWAAGAGYPSSPPGPSTAQSAPASPPPSNPTAPAGPRARQVMQQSSQQVGALRARAPQPPSWAGGTLEAIGRGIQGIPQLATGVAAAPGAVVASGMRALGGPLGAARAAFDPAYLARQGLRGWGQAEAWRPMQAAGRDIAAPVENAYQMPVEEIGSRLGAPFTGADEQAHQFARQSATPGLTDEFRGGAQRSYERGLDPDAGAWSRWWNNRAGDAASVAPVAMSFLGMAGPTGRLASRVGARMTATGVNSGARWGPALANAGASVANAGQGLVPLGEGFMLGGHQVVQGLADPNAQGKGQEVAQQAAEEKKQVEDAVAGRVPVKHISTFAEVADMHPAQAPMLRGRAQQTIDNYARKLQEAGTKFDPAAGTPELAGALRDLIGARMLEGGLKEDPKVLYDRLAKGDVSYNEVMQVADMPGNEEIAGGPDRPPGERLGGFLGFFKNPDVPDMTKALVGLGIPVALLGVLSSVLGEGGLGGVLLSVLGLGAAAYGAHQGGLLQGTTPGGMMDSVFGAPNVPAPGGGAGPAGAGVAPAAGQAGPAAFLTPEVRRTFMAARPEDRPGLIRQALDQAPGAEAALRQAHSAWNANIGGLALPGRQTVTGALIRRQLGMPDLGDEEIQAVMDAYQGGQ